MDLAVALIYLAGSVVCHQLPERSFFWTNGVQLPVCARCTGLYLGGLLAVLGWVGLKVRVRGRGWPLDPGAVLRVTVIASLPTLVSVALSAAGVWDGTNVLRAALALPAGLAGGVVVAAAATKDLR